MVGGIETHILNCVFNMVIISIDLLGRVGLSFPLKSLPIFRLSSPQSLIYERKICITLKNVKKIMNLNGEMTPNEKGGFNITLSKSDSLLSLTIGLGISCIMGAANYLGNYAAAKLLDNKDKKRKK